jgi:hypothetical protein
MLPSKNIPLLPIKQATRQGGLKKLLRKSEKTYLFAFLAAVPRQAKITRQRHAMLRLLLNSAIPTFPGWGFPLVGAIHSAKKRFAKWRWRCH